jgi:hypothetical protein
MNAPHPANSVFRALTRLAVPTQIKQVHAVAEAIGCPEWTTPEGCNRKGECFCATAAARVVEIERARQ